MLHNEPFWGVGGQGGEGENPPNKSPVHLFVLIL